MIKSFKFIQTTAPSPQTHTLLQRQARRISVSDAFLAVVWLNAKKGTAAYARVMAVRNELSELGTMLDLIAEQKQANKAKRVINDDAILEWHKEALCQARLVEQHRNRHNALNETLAKYTFVPALTYDLGAGVWRYNLTPRRQAHEIEVPDQTVTVRVGEAAVVAALSRLAVRRELDRVRLCEQCHESWRESERKMDRFCSAACREQSYINSPEFRSRKALQQREYRQRERDRQKRKAFN